MNYRLEEQMKGNSDDKVVKWYAIAAVISVVTWGIWHSHKLN